MPPAERPPDPYELVEEDLRLGAAAVLERTGPLPFDELYGLLHRAGVFAPLDEEGDDHRWMIDGLVEHSLDDFHATADELVAYVPELVDGIALSHVLTPGERRRSMIDLGLDLAVLPACRYRYDLPAGGRVQVTRSYPSPEATSAAIALGLPTDDDADPHGSLIGPDGWLDAFAAGDLLSVHVCGRTLAVARTHLRCLPRLTRSPLVAALEIAARLRTEEAEDGYVVLEGWPEHLVLDALAHHRTLLRGPDLPVSTAFAHLGIEWDGETLIRRHATAGGRTS